MMTIQTLDSGFNDYWKVPVSLLCELCIVEYISNFSYIGNSDTLLNQEGYAYLEMDADILVFAKAMKYNDKTFNYDHDTLQTEYFVKDLYHDEWTKALTHFDVEKLEGYSWGEIPEGLLKAINYNENDLENVVLKDCEN